MALREPHKNASYLVTPKPLTASTLSPVRDDSAAAFGMSARGEILFKQPFALLLLPSSTAAGGIPSLLPVRSGATEAPAEKTRRNRESAGTRGTERQPPPKARRRCHPAPRSRRSPAGAPRRSPNGARREPGGLLPRRAAPSSSRAAAGSAVSAKISRNR